MLNNSCSAWRASSLKAAESDRCFFSDHLTLRLRTDHLHQHQPNSLCICTSSIHSLHHKSCPFKQSCITLVAVSGTLLGNQTSRYAPVCNADEGTLRILVANLYCESNLESELGTEVFQTPWSLICAVECPPHRTTPQPTINKTPEITVLHIAKSRRKANTQRKGEDRQRRRMSRDEGIQTKRGRLGSLQESCMRTISSAPHMQPGLC